MTQYVLPTRRDLKFELPGERVADWHSAGMHVAQYFNTLSLFFPVGERFFIDSVRKFRDRAKDDELKQAITAFIGQEAMHSREHAELNELLDAADVPVKAQERLVTRLLRQVEQRTPAEYQLAVTVALEHLTAILADAVLDNPEVLGDPQATERRYAALWNWHALEETEHKAVAFDLYTVVMGKTLKGYALRTSTLVVATTMFFALQYAFYVQNVASKGGLFNLKGWLTSLNYQFGRPGVLRKAMLPWLDWFKPGFHPWDHDNRHFLEQVDTLLGEFLETPPRKGSRKAQAA